VDTISFGPGRTPRRWRPGWLHRGRQPWRGRPGGRTWLVVTIAVTAGAATAIALVTTAGGASHPPTARSPSTSRSPSTASSPSAPLSLLSGLPADGVSTDLFLAGENLWRVGRLPQTVAAGFLVNGLSPLLPAGHGAEADQLTPVPGGVVAHISDTSTGISYGALGRVVFIPAGNAPARVIARATMIAVSVRCVAIRCPFYPRSPHSSLRSRPVTAGGSGSMSPCTSSNWTDATSTR
jgi:hypothetical protein